MNLENLPRDARLKLEALGHRNVKRQALLDGVYRSVRDCEARCVRFSNMIRSAGSDEQAAEYRTKLEAARGEHERLTVERSRCAGEHRSAAQDFARIEDWAAKLPESTRLRITPKRATTYDAERLAKIRADIGELQSEIGRIERAPLDTASQRTAMAQEFEAALATLYLERSPFGTKLCTRTPSLRVLTPLEFEWWRRPRERDGLLALLVPEDPDGMTVADKIARLEPLRARLLSAERAEEALIEAGEELGLFVERRSSDSPTWVLAVLGLALVVEKQEAQKAAA